MLTSGVARTGCFSDSESFSATHLASRQAYEAGCAGIYYLSRYGHDLENWAIFEPFPIRPKESTPIATNDKDLLQALKILGLELSAH